MPRFMTSPAKAFGLLSAMLGGLLLNPVQAAPPGWEPVRLDYEVYARGFNPLRFSALLEFGESRYDIQLQGETQGVIGALFFFEMEARSTGVLENGRLLPRRYRTANQIGSRDLRWVHLDYGGGQGGPERVRIEPDPASDERETVPATAREGTVDPISAIFAVLLQSMDGCSGSFPVFDGRRLYEVSGEDRGWAVAAPRETAAYDGSVQICRLRMERRGGFSEEYEPDERSPGHLDVWMAEIQEGAPPVPVRVQTDSSIGTITMHLADFTSGDGARLPPRGLIRQVEAALHLDQSGQ